MCSAVSVAQTGTTAFRIPVPQPLTRRAIVVQPQILEWSTVYLTADHPSRVLSRALKGSTNDGPEGTKTNRLDTAVPISKRATDETADESSEVVDRNL